MAGGVDSLAWALPAALSAAHGEREQAQGAIQACALLPGYCTRLLQFTAAFELGDSARLLAATQLKNEILRRWCAGPRGIPEAERHVLREGLLARLATDEPCEHVGLQIGMTVARIMRSEANRGLGTVLQAFIDAMLQRQHLPPHALLALLHTAKELGTMRLPAQKLLAARVARLLLPSLSQQWSAALHAAMQPASDERSVAAATLFTKVVRQLHDRIAAVAARPDPEAEAEQERRQEQQQLAESAQLVLAVAPLVQQRCASSGAGAAWVRLAGALGKLLGALAARDTCGGEGGEGGEGEEGEEGGGCAAGAGDGSFPWGEAARVCWGVLLLEAEGRQQLLASPHGGEGGEGGEGRALAALAARERGASALPTHCARLLERGVGGRAAVAAAVAAPLAARPELLPALLCLMALPAAQLAEWEADAEEFACGTLLPPLEPLDAGPGEEDDEEDSGGEGAEEEEGGAGFDEADAGVAGAAANVGGHAHRLQQAAETLLVALLWSCPEAAPLLAQQLPTEPCTAAEPLPRQLRREAAYAALGLCACQLQDTFGYGTLLAACLREANALATAAAPPPPPTPTAPRLSGLLQARLCWLLSCWWAFGAAGDDEEDARATAASFHFLATMLHAGADAAARLQAAQVLRTLLDGADAEAAALFRPAAPAALGGLAAALRACEGDEAALRLLRLLRVMLRLLPGALDEAPQSGLREALGALWEAAQREQRLLLLRELRCVQRLVGA